MVKADRNASFVGHWIVLTPDERLFTDLTSTGYDLRGILSRCYPERLQLIINWNVKLLVVWPDTGFFFNWRFFLRFGIQFDTDIKLNLFLLLGLAIIVILKPISGCTA